MTHEAFHAADSTVLDDGGYPGAPEDFKRRSPDEKLVNASHYEEVARRFLKASPVGGDFEPAVRKEQGHDGTMMEVDTRTPLQQATDRVRHTVQLAWERCQNVHGFLKSLVHKTYESDKMNEHMRAEAFKPLFYWSRLLHLQIHDRFVEAHKARVTVNYIDLLQVESLTRSIGRMMKTDLVQLLDQTPIHAQKTLNLSNAQFAKLIVDHLLIVLVNQHADARWLKPDAFKGMIEELSVAPQDVSKVTG